MSRAALWRLPEEALYFDEEQQSWKVMAARGLGESRAIFIPLVKMAAGWQVSVAADDRLPLTRVPSGHWVALPRRGGAQGCVYLCALRYDLPSNHPDDSYLTGPEAAPGTQAGAEPPADVSGRELSELFARLQLRSPDRIDIDVVDGPEDPPAQPGSTDDHAPAAASAAAAVARAAARARTAAPAPAPQTQEELPRELTFAFGSCQYPAGMLDRPVAHTAYRALAAYLKLPGCRTPERLLLLGDQVYTDATYGMLDPARLDDRYRMPYEDLRDRDSGPFSALPLQFLSRVRVTPDDHEFVDNWEPWRPKVSSPRFDKGLQAFWEHQRRRPGAQGEPVHLQEQHAGWRLFMTDTRTQRSYRSAETLHEARIMGKEQWRELRCWLTRGGPEELKIVTSAAMLLPRSREYMDDPVYLDNWQGYPASFHELLALLCEHEVANVVFLSGDAHLACTAEVTVRDLDSGKSVGFKSHHAPALYAPYPFANESRWNLLLQDAFRFTASLDGQQHTYECSVLTTLVDEGHDGCGLMNASRNGSTWSTKVDVLR
jgi:hypothetical protein